MQTGLPPTACEYRFAEDFPFFAVILQLPIWEFTKASTHSERLKVTFLAAILGLAEVRAWAGWGAGSEDGWHAARGQGHCTNPTAAPTAQDGPLPDFRSRPEQSGQTTIVLADSLGRLKQW